MFSGNMWKLIFQPPIRQGRHVDFCVVAEALLKQALHERSSTQCRDVSGLNMSRRMG